MQRFLCPAYHYCMRILFILSAIAVSLLSGCSKKTDNKETAVRLRIENLDAATIDSIVVQNPAGRQVYYNITSGAKSDYKTFAYIYNYGYIKAYYSNKTLVMQPIDYVGETKLEQGNYTYKVYVISNFASSYLSVDNRKD
jgi:hypothetical protein